MRISDWSSDVCSSDLLLLAARLCLAAVFLYSGATKLLSWQAAIAEFEQIGLPFSPLAVAATVIVQLSGGLAVALGWRVRLAALGLAAFTVIATLRSEEHTSELQSLMRISYAVFCL